MTLFERVTMQAMSNVSMLPIGIAFDEIESVWSAAGKYAQFLVKETNIAFISLGDCKFKVGNMEVLFVTKKEAMSSMEWFGMFDDRDDEFPFCL